MTKEMGLARLISTLELCNESNECEKCPLVNEGGCYNTIYYNAIKYLKLLQNELKEKYEDKHDEIVSLPEHWIWTDDGVINPDNVLYVQLDGPQTKIRMVEGKMYLNGDPFGLTQRTKPREKPKDLEDD